MQRFPRYKEVSTRLMRPTQPEIEIGLLMKYLADWNQSYETEGEVLVRDEGIAQYLLYDRDSHHKFYAALILNKPSLRCRIVPEDEGQGEDGKSPFTDRMEASNRLILIGGEGTEKEKDALAILTGKLEKKNYKFSIQ